MEEKKIYMQFEDDYRVQKNKYNIFKKSDVNSKWLKNKNISTTKKDFLKLVNNTYPAFQVKCGNGLNVRQQKHINAYVLSDVISYCNFCN